ncbi:MAG TPA: cytochrome c oxidase subunit 3 [Candidatus Limnocylindria bacterium]|nr:cytochrome c oxidase subunit 3 [Candidatus Limnocylindria bacterium]
MSTRTEPRTVIRGRRERPRDRLPVNETGLDAQPARFTSGMWAVILFVSSEAMFFGALFTAYFYLRGRVHEWEPVLQRCIADVCEKPHWNAQSELFGITLPLVAINTVLLVSSSFTMQFAVNAIKKGDRAGLRNWLIPTIVLGTLFLAGQAYEYTKLGFLPDNGVFAGVFFTLTGFHGAHVTGGVLMNTYVFFRTMKGQFTARRHLAVEAASIYWHFVDVVWIGLFATIYIVG